MISSNLIRVDVLLPHRDAGLRGVESFCEDTQTFYLWKYSCNADRLVVGDIQCG